MNFQVEVAFIGLIQSMAVAAIAGFFARESKKRKKAQDAAEARAALQAEESLLAVKLMSASLNLAIATATAVKNSDAAGPMGAAIDAALREAEKAGEAYQDFIKTVATRQISSGKG